MEPKECESMFREMVEDYKNWLYLAECEAEQAQKKVEHLRVELKKHQDSLEAHLSNPNF